MELSDNFHPSADNGAIIDGGGNVEGKDNTNTDPGAGNIRWRHQGNTTAGFLFVDGHVEPKRYKSRNSNDLKKLNINVNK